MKTFRPQVERLEDLLAPVIFNDIWVGPAGGLWSTPANWSLGRIPSVDTNAVFDARMGVGTNTSNQMNLGGGGSFHIAGLIMQHGYTGTITLASNINIDILNMRSNGSIVGPRALTIWQKTGDGSISDAAQFGTSFWRAGTVQVALLNLWGEEAHRCILQIGAPTNNVNLRSDVEISVFSAVEWRANPMQTNNVSVSDGVTITNFGTFVADSPGSTFGPTPGLRARIVLRNGSLLTISQGTLRMTTAVNGGRLVEGRAAAQRGAVDGPLIDGDLTVQSGSVEVDDLLTVSGDFSMDSSSELDLNIQSFFAIEGTASLAGTLNVAADYYVLDQYPLISWGMYSGTFDSVYAPDGLNPDYEDWGFAVKP